MRSTRCSTRPGSRRRRSMSSAFTVRPSGIAPRHRRTLQIGDGARLAAATRHRRRRRLPHGRRGGRRPGRAARPRSITPRWPARWRSRSPCSTSAASATSPGSAQADGASRPSWPSTPVPATPCIDDWVLARDRSRLRRRRPAGGDAAGSTPAGVWRWLRARLLPPAMPPKSLDRDAFRFVLARRRRLSLPPTARRRSPPFTRARRRLGVAAAARRAADAGSSAAAVGTIRLLMRMIADGASARRSQPVEAVGWRGDFLEAEAFAFLAVRSLRGLPLTLPTTTGAPGRSPAVGSRQPNRRRLRRRARREHVQENDAHRDAERQE